MAKQTNHANLGVRPPPEVKPSAMESIIGKTAELVTGAVNAIGDKVKENYLSQPKFSGQMEALGREAFKDVNGTLQEVFFGKPPGPSEPGTPLAPTQSMITNDLGKMPGMDELRAHAKQRANEASQRMEGPPQDFGMTL